MSLRIQTGESQSAEGVTCRCLPCYASHAVVVLFAGDTLGAHQVFGVTMYSVPAAAGSARSLARAKDAGERLSHLYIVLIYFLPSTSF